MKTIFATFFFVVFLFNTQAAEATNSDKTMNSGLNIETLKKTLSSVNWHSLTDNNQWAYTVETTLDNGNTGKKIQQTKQRYDPSLPRLEQWTLIESDYSAPSAARLADYSATQNQLATEEPKVDTTGLEIVDLDTLTLFEDGEHTQTFHFTPKLPMFDEETNQLFKGVLTVNKITQLPVSLHVEAQQSFSPQMAFKINGYALTMKLENIKGALHVTLIESKKSGKAFYFTNFNEASTRTFSNFERVN